MSRSFRKYPIYKKSKGNKNIKKNANKTVRNSKELKNGNLYKKHIYIDKYPTCGYAKTLEKYLELCEAEIPLDKAYKDWICHYYIK